MNGNSYLIDMTEVERQIEALYAAAGYTRRIPETGETVRDEDKFKARVYELVKSKVVPDKHSRSENSWTPGELYAAAFPGAPGTDGTDPENLDPNEREVRSKLKRKVSQLTGPGVSGFVQKRLAREGNGTFVLCRGPVMRGLDELPGIYVTDDPEVIMADSVDPQVEALVRKANSLRKHVEMVGGRHPELASRITAALGSGIDRTRAALPAAHADGAASGAKSARPEKAKS